MGKGWIQPLTLREVLETLPESLLKQFIYYMCFYLRKELAMLVYSGFRIDGTISKDVLDHCWSSPLHHPSKPHAHGDASETRDEASPRHM